MRSLAAMVIAAALLAGCGGEGADKRSDSGERASARSAPGTRPPARVQNLLRRIPGDTDEIEVMDWQRARAELGLDERVDPADAAFNSRVEHRFEEAAQFSAAHLRSPGGFEHIPAERAIDHRLVTAAVSAGQATGSINPVVLVATSEPRRAIVERVRRAGYRRTGSGLYVHRDADDIPYGIVGVSDQVVVFGEDPDEVSSALVPRRPTRAVQRLLRLLDRVEGARRYFRSYYLPSAESACVRAVAASEDFRDNIEDLVLHVPGRAAAGRVKLGRELPADPSRARLLRDYKVSDIRAEGDTVWMRVTNAADPMFRVHAADLAADLLEASDVYACA